MRLNGPEVPLRPLRSWVLGVVVLGPATMMVGCGGGDKANMTGTQAPPVQDDYGKTMEEFLKKNPQSQQPPK